jgi:hypothetical protein
MITKDVIAAVKRHKGPIQIGLVAADDVIWVQIVKSDLLAAIAKTEDWQIEWSVKNGTGYVDRCYGRPVDA